MNAMLFCRTLGAAPDLKRPLQMTVRHLPSRVKVSPLQMGGRSVEEEEEEEGEGAVG